MKCAAGSDATRRSSAAATTVPMNAMRTLLKFDREGVLVTTLRERPLRARLAIMSGWGSRPAGERVGAEAPNGSCSVDDQGRQCG
jgi:hypothetical protein